MILIIIEILMIIIITALVIITFVSKMVEQEHGSSRRLINTDPEPEE